MKKVVVTGIGVLLPNCDRRDVFWQQLSRGESQLTFQPDPGRPGARVAMGRVEDFDPARYLVDVPRHFYERYDRETQLYLASVFNALRDAHLDLGGQRVDLDRVGLFDGVSRPTFQAWYERISQQGPDITEAGYTRRDLMTRTPGLTVGMCASLLGIRGPAYTFCGTCSAGAMAIGHAFREVRDGEIDVAIATGHESAITAPTFASYREANLLSLEDEDPRRAVRPFTGSSANAIGEGAVTLILESAEHAEARGAEVLAELGGYKYGNNGYHPTAVDPRGERPAQLIEQLLLTTGTSPDDVGFVVGHGNAVHLSDQSEQAYMQRVFGPRAPDVPLVSTKPIYGHTLGASSSVNAAAAVLILHQGYVIPTLNVDPGLVPPHLDHRAQGGLQRQSRAGLSVSYGMGGHNAVLLLRPA